MIGRKRDQLRRRSWERKEEGKAREREGKGKEPETPKLSLTECFIGIQFLFQFLIDFVRFNRDEGNDEVHDERKAR